MCSEAEARQIIGPGGAAVMIDIVEGAWEAYQDEARRRRPRARANIVWEYMADLAEDLLSPMDGVERVDLTADTPGFVLRGRLLVRFKKHDKKCRTSNVATRVQTRLAETGTFDGMPARAHVSCGYILDAAEAGIGAIVVSRMIENKVEWWIDLRELAAGQLAPVQPIIPDLDVAGQLAPLPSIAGPAEKQEGGEE